MNISWVIPSVFIFLMSSVVWFLIGVKGVWWIKLAILIATPLLAMWAWVSIDDAMGYPKPTTESQLKGKTATLFFQVVDEPRSIFLWVKLDSEEKMRLYQLPYSRSLHKAVDESGAGSKGSERIKFGESNPGGKPAAGGGSTQGELEFYILPPPISQPKISSQSTTVR